MDKKIIEKLKQDEHYYGDYGKQFLSNSDISILLKNPKLLRETKPKSTAMVIGGYFHTAILEPNKLKSFRIIESSTRNTKKYKEMSEGEICLLQHEVDKIELMQEAVMDNSICRGLIKGDFEVPAVTELLVTNGREKQILLIMMKNLLLTLKQLAILISLDGLLLNLTMIVKLISIATYSVMRCYLW